MRELHPSCLNGRTSPTTTTAMRPFRFRLETVRRLRDHAEQRARDDLARELSAQAALADDVRRSRDAVSTARTGARVADVRARASWEAFIERRDREQRLAETELLRQSARVDETRVVLGQASREHRAITRLEDKHRERYADEQRRVDEAELSDIAGRAYHRAVGGAA